MGLASSTTRTDSGPGSGTGSGSSSTFGSSSGSKRVPPFKAHWVTPSLMFGSVLLGLLLAVGHHLFYNSIDGKVVESSDQQVWNLRVGTGMAFVVKASLTAAAGMAYTQLLWHTLRSQEISLDGIDAVFSVVNNVYGFTTLEIWLRCPALVCIAFMMWLLPFIAIVTPSALTVQSSNQLNESTVLTSLPVIEYASPKTFAEYANAGGGGYAAPSNAVARLLAAVASQGSIAHISAPYSNCSYSVEFYGPSLSCGYLPRDDPLYDRIDSADFSSTMISFVGFVPQTSPEHLNISRAYDTMYGLNVTVDRGLTSGLITLDTSYTSTDHARIYVVVPNVYGAANTTIECGLYNSSYVVDFSFTNGQQDVTVRNRTRLNGVTWSSGGITTSYNVQQVAYTAIINALGNLLVGTLRRSQYGYITARNTLITSTILMQTTEMQRLLAVTQSFFDDAPEKLSLRNMTMSRALEQIVANTTLSLFSNSYFLQNDTTAAIGKVQVRTSQNEYIYKPRNLFIAYSISVGLTFSVVIIGFICIWVSSLSFGSSFSTILRTTRNPELDFLLRNDENRGAEPLPKGIAKSKLGFQHLTCENGLKSGGIFIVPGKGDAAEQRNPRRAPSQESLEPTYFF
ncbi:hypothetical protein EDB81DRAFT_787984 [Dactylonectria macrodidyma]|uniref:Transmembrane protein n=1 Tax=Dactylonectria macrodidyma TaxID=307937 RepID=A0A9P9JE47_9HYPO|nr:hypothetical protein EDB81DRAFT_787984 [Dactylonectria macrodidyma]